MADGVTHLEVTPHNACQGNFALEKSASRTTERFIGALPAGAVIRHIHHNPRNTVGIIHPMQFQHRIGIGQAGRFFGRHHQ